MPTILTTDDNHARDVARRLLDAAGDQPDLVQTVTGGSRLAFDVPDEVAKAAGFVIDQADDASEPDDVDQRDDDTSQPEAPAPKSTSRRGKAKTADEG